MRYQEFKLTEYTDLNKEKKISLLRFQAIQLTLLNKQRFLIEFIKLLTKVKLVLTLTQRLLSRWVTKINGVKARVTKLDKK